MECPFVLSNDPMPTRQGEIGTVLLSSFEEADATYLSISPKCELLGSHMGGWEFSVYPDWPHDDWLGGP